MWISNYGSCGFQFDRAYSYQFGISSSMVAVADRRLSQFSKVLSTIILVRIDNARKLDISRISLLLENRKDSISKINKSNPNPRYR